MKMTPEKASELGSKSSRKGIPNKTTAETREAFSLLVSGNLPKIQEMIDRVAKEDPARAVELILKAAQFVLPRLQAVELKAQVTVADILSLTPEERRRKIIELRKTIITEKPKK